jgi:hypothetical protein
MNNNLTAWRKALELHNIPPKKGTKTHECVKKTYDRLLRGEHPAPKLEPTHCPRSRPRLPPSPPPFPRQPKPRLPRAPGPRLPVRNRRVDSSEDNDVVALRQEFTLIVTPDEDDAEAQRALDSLRKMIENQEGPFNHLPRDFFERQAQQPPPANRVVFVPQVRRVQK